jgi:hypothetical protein
VVSHQTPPAPRTSGMPREADGNAIKERHHKQPQVSISQLTKRKEITAQYRNTIWGD